MKLFLIPAALFLAIPYNLIAAVFPLSDTTQIDQTYGDYNGAFYGYHDGVDFFMAGTDTVRSPVSGVVHKIYNSFFDEYNNYIAISTNSKIDFWCVGHTIPKDNLQEGSPISAGDVIGTVVSAAVSPGGYRHVHIGRAFSSTQPYKGELEDPLHYFSPITQSLGLQSNDIMFTMFTASAALDRPTLEAKFPKAPNGDKIIHDDTDIIVFGRNNVNGGNKSGVY